MLKRGTIRKRFLMSLITVECAFLLALSLTGGILYTRYLVEKHLQDVQITLEREAHTLTMAMQKESVRCEGVVRNETLVANLSKIYNKDLEERLKFKQQLYSVVTMLEMYEYEAGTSYSIFTDNYDLIVSNRMLRLEQIDQSERVQSFLRDTRVRSVWDYGQSGDAVNLYLYMRFFSFNSYTNILRCTVPLAPGLLDTAAKELQDSGGIWCCLDTGEVLYSTCGEIPAGQLFREEAASGYRFSEHLLPELMLGVLIPRTIWKDYAAQAFGKVLMLLLPATLLIILNARLSSRRMTKEIELFADTISRDPMQYLELRTDSDYETLEVDQIEKSFLHVLEEFNSLHKDLLEKEKRTSALEMDLLQARINPHLIYNSLSIIKWRMLERGEEKDAELVDALTRYYRLALSRGKTQIPLQQEIEMLRQYVQLIEHTKETKIQMNISVPDALKTCLVHKHLLQPFVENSVMHGFDLQSDKPKIISVSADTLGENIRIVIEDNGLGVTPQIAQQLEQGSYQSEYGGYGIRNVLERMRNYYADAFIFHIMGSEQTGTRVELMYPLQGTEEREAETK